MDVRAWNEKWQHGVCARGAHVMLGLWISFNTSACHVEFVQLWLLNPLKAVVNISLLESAGSVSCTGGLWVDGDPPALYRAVSRSASAHKFQSKKKQHLCRSICFCWVFQILLFTRGRKTTEQICKCTWVTRQKNCPYDASPCYYLLTRHLFPPNLSSLYQTVVGPPRVNRHCGIYYLLVMQSHGSKDKI